MNKSMSIESKLSAVDRMGRRIAARLDASTQELPHDISERLRVARLQALERHRAAAPVLASVNASGTATLLAGGDEERGFWPRLVSLIPLLALLAGLIALQIQGDDSLTEELAAIDAAILTDDLPPDAYADPGFAQFLKSRLQSGKD
ncbi:MAG TPA: DUF3619 domain-containing protein [Curvibacter sp.]|nr:DUF3619 domain-containing protein [Curvibacter sp.]|tara:strand:+ start:341 stop:781 length:441 start_codon:yes stop_codon:yes gene_type:complete